MSVLWFRASTYYHLDQKFTQNAAQTILHYHTTKNSFLASIDWSRFQNMFWKNISCFPFWWKTYTKRCTNNYVISRVKYFLRLHFAVDEVLSISGNDLENGRMPRKEKYEVKNVAVKIPTLILFRFCLLCWLSPAPIVATSCFNL